VIQTLLRYGRPCGALLAALFSLSLLPAQAGELLVVGAHFDRVYEQGKDGQFAGMGPEIVRAVAQRLGHTVQFQLYPWPRAQALVAQGKADILVGPYKSSERLATLAFSERAFYQDKIVFYTRANAGFDWDRDYAALQGKRIVVLNGWAYGDEFDRARPSLQLSVANTVENGLNMLAHQHVDLFASNLRNTEPVIARLNMAGKFIALPRIINVQDGYFAFPKRMEYDGLRAQFDQAFNAMVDSGELKKLGRQLDVNVP